MVRTCKATSERLHVLPERLQLTPGEPHKGPANLKPRGLESIRGEGRAES